MATVKQLIEYLEQFPPEAQVKLSTYGCGTTSSYPYELHRINMRGKDVVIEAEDN